VVPKGWKTYDFGLAAISVPPAWTVKRDLNCPNTGGPVTGPATLLLGLPADPDHCPVYHYPANVVALTTRNPAAQLGSLACRRTAEVDGSPVAAIPCGPGVWLVPALGIEAMASGPHSSAVLHTLRRATPSG
jgi:hypothetical protein